MLRINRLPLERLHILPPPLTLADGQRAKLLEVFQRAETAAAWLEQELSGILRENPACLDHPQYAGWRIVSGVVQGLLDLRKELIAWTSSGR